jgi:N-acetylglucosamine malate deacetylase 2
MTEILARVAAGQPISGRHVVVVAHPDDEVISCAGALCCLSEVTSVQLTEDTDAREAERMAAAAAAGWSFPVRFGGTRFRQAHLAAARLLALVAAAIADADVVWTHPYEGGHLDHDTAAWLVQTACSARPTPPLHLEFASYHATHTGQVFGDFWPDANHPTRDAVLTGDRLEKKLAALAAYGSQASILSKFPDPRVEHYRVAPRYDFTRPAPPPRSRWDVKGYQPSTAVWRATVAEVSS